MLPTGLLLLYHILIYHGIIIGILKGAKMKFKVESDIFEKIPDLYIGVVVAKGIDNSKTYPEIDKLLEKSIKLAERRFLDKKVKEDASIVPYREAFSKLGMNPNKFQCSAEALFTRISKGKGLPNINPLVDLNNAVSLKHTLPMGTHDLSLSHNDIELRYTRKGDVFIPMGSDKKEELDLGEVAYIVGNEVRTRRWAWRQGEHGKITAETNYVFFPIDGFHNINDVEVDKAANELAELLKRIFGCKVKIGYVDCNQQSFEWSF